MAIHQPNFFPWLGYFDKIARSDHFVFLDHVQYQKTGATWSNRVRLMVGGNAQWVTAPINRAFHGVRAVNEIEFSSGDPWRDRVLKTLAANYGRAPFYLETMTVVEPLVLDPDNNLARYNSRAITALAAHLALPQPAWHWSSAFDIESHASELLIAIAKRVGAGSYLCGGGAEGYQEDAAFAASDVGLQYQHFIHPQYEQRGNEAFVPGLSIIDALMNAGRTQVASLLSSARQVS